MEPGMLGDHSDYSHCLSLQGTEDGPPCPRLGVGSQSCPLNNTPFRVGGQALDTSCLWARMSRSFIHQGCCHSPPTGGGGQDTGGPSPTMGTQKGVLRMTLLPSASGQQAAVLCQGRGLFHAVPDPGSVVEPVGGGQQSAAPAAACQPRTDLAGWESRHCIRPAHPETRTSPAQTQGRRQC